MTPAASILQPNSNPALYVAAVLTLYVDLPDTPLLACVPDQRHARIWFDRGVSLEVVETALLLACLRRRTRPTDVPPLPRVRSLAYFQPIIDELLDHPAPGGYLHYLRLKLRGTLDNPTPAKVQKSTFSDEWPWPPERVPSRRMKRRLRSETLSVLPDGKKGRYCGGLIKPLMNVAWTSVMGSRTVVAAPGG